MGAGRPCRGESPLGRFFALFGQGTTAASQGDVLDMCVVVLVNLSTPPIRTAFGVTGRPLLPDEAPEADHKQAAKG